MDIIKAMNYRILLLATLIGFSVLKWQDLALPYYWDELGVYMQGVLHFVEHGPGLLPSSMDADLSRGHPLLFYFLVAVWAKYLGTSVVTVHIFTFAISILFVCVVYRLGEKHFSPLTGWLGAVILLVQPMFYSISTMVLPEIMLALFCLLSVYSALDNKVWLTALWSTLALQVKETAIILPLVFVIWEILKSRNKEVDKSKVLYNSLIYSIPWLVFLIFISIQKSQKGWFFFPYHTGFISFEWVSIRKRLSQYIYIIAIKQGRFTWLIACLAAGLSYFVKLRKGKQGFGLNELQLLFLVYVIGGLGYSSLNFLMPRYSLFIFPLIILFVVHFVQTNLYVKEIRLLLIIAMIATPVWFMHNRSHRIMEDDMSFRDMVLVQKEVASLIDTDSLRSLPVAASFPVKQILYSGKLGYITSESLHPLELNEPSLAQAKLIIYSKPGNLDEMKIDSSGFTRLATFERGDAQAIVYKRLTE